MNNYPWKVNLLSLCIGLMLAALVAAEGVESAGGADAGLLSIRHLLSTRDAYAFAFGLESYVFVLLAAVALIAIERSPRAILFWALMLGLFHHVAVFAYALARVAHGTWPGAGALLPGIPACRAASDQDKPAAPVMTHPGS